MAANNPFEAGRVSDRARLVLLKGSGGDGATYTLSASEHVAGRSSGTILFPDDPAVSPAHANFHYRDGRLYVRDLDSVNGTFIRIRTGVPLQSGDRFVCGEQMFEFRTPPESMTRWVEDTCFSGSTELDDFAFQLVQVLAGDRPGLARCYGPASVTIGREGCTLSFATDRFMSHEHSRIGPIGAEIVLEDAGSKNGTYFRIRGEAGLQDGDTLFIGRQLVRVELT